MLRSINHFDRNYAHLSDTVIGPVLPSSRVRTNEISNTSPLLERRNPPISKDERERLKAIKKEVRRAQIRAGQARYRQKNRDLEQRLQQSVQQLRTEIQPLTQKRTKLRLRRPQTPSRWHIVGEVFRLIDKLFRSPQCLSSAEDMKRDFEIRRNLAFLEGVFTTDVAMADLNGFDALLKQIRRYSLYFRDPNMELNRIETVTAGVVRASGKLSVTITEFTLEVMFPHLELSKHNADNREDSILIVRSQLLGRRLECSFAMNFLFGEESGRVERLETDIDFLGSLSRAIKNVKTVLRAFEMARITPEGVVGGLTECLHGSKLYSSAATKSIYHF